MAGRPKRARDLAAIDLMPRDKVEELLQTTMGMPQICKSLGVGRRALEEWLDQPSQAGLLSRARARAADDIVSETIDIADSIAFDDNPQIAKVRIQTRQWVAERWNAPAYAQNKGQNVSISIAGLRLDALRHVEIVEQPKQIGGTNGGTDGDA